MAIALLKADIPKCSEVFVIETGTVNQLFGNVGFAFTQSYLPNVEIIFYPEID